MRKVAILFPTAYRPRELARCLNSLFDTLDRRTVAILVSPIEDDIQSIRVALDVAQKVRSREEYEKGSLYGYNFCLKALPDADVYAIAADDLVFYPNWLGRALFHLDEMGGGLVGYNDLSSDGNQYAAHGLVSRDFLIETMGGRLCPPDYKTWWADFEWTDKAKAVGRYHWAQDAIVEHLHYSFGKAPLDRTYTEAHQNYEADRAVYEARRAAGFPQTWEPIITPLLNGEGR